MSKGLITTCCCVRSVHIKFTPDLSIKSFLLAFRLSISRCGVPENIISNNFKTFKSKEVRNFMRYLRVKVNFILEKSLWLVGFYEGMVRIVKNALKKVVGRASLDRDQLNTVLIEIENIINSRPLTYISEEHFEESLTPYHLIYGRNIAVNKVSYLSKDMDGNSIRSNYNKVNILLKHFSKDLQRSIYLYYMNVIHTVMIVPTKIVDFM